MSELGQMLPFHVEGVAAAAFVGHPPEGATRSVASSVPDVSQVDVGEPLPSRFSR
jgi:hypothetical protein